MLTMKISFEVLDNSKRRKRANEAVKEDSSSG